jgi:hypothetical protein
VLYRECPTGEHSSLSFALFSLCRPPDALIYVVSP